MIDRLKIDDGLECSRGDWASTGGQRGVNKGSVGSDEPQRTQRFAEGQVGNFLCAAPRPLWFASCDACLVGQQGVNEGVNGASTKGSTRRQQRGQQRGQQGVNGRVNKGVNGWRFKYGLVDFVGGPDGDSRCRPFEAGQCGTYDLAGPADSLLCAEGR